ncbi:SDR family NAD(P)-dependent oxidoreductase [Petroclostridium sp. X23]|uniref:SDR family NAD(P)-dependent oxidoreductase n=1 Tax=Petroclostridium sp. X23 TaxID=3045146 RepID=UPI0024ACF06A|nr:SDR family NAD(P)-dependent oxidoreductase [Petroclostridium sp. X23]WHH60222.1 SDR family NAD(P)-dependent oxidoreductase [Petroclostridium sp. X23]
MLMDFKDLFSLHSMTAIVTGGAQGLGKSICEGLAYFGAKVAVVDLNKENAKKTADEICRQGGSAIAIGCDVSNGLQVKEAVDQAIRKLDKVDILVANAGIGDRNAAEDMTVEQWDKVIDINLKGVWLFNQEVGKHLIKRGEGGCIINMSSITGIVGIKTGNANYSAAKGGVAALTRTLAVEWGQYHIRVNAIAPAQVKTPLVNKLIESKADINEYFLNRIPLGRLGEPIDIAGAAVFLASPAASWITGHLLAVDGGNTIMY